MEILSEINTTYECIEEKCDFYHYCNKEKGCMDECLSYFFCVRDDEKIINLTNTLIEKFPEEIYEYWSLYSILLYSFVLSDNLTNIFLEKALDDDYKEEAKKLLNNDQILHNKIQKIWQIINVIKNELFDLCIHENDLDDFGLTEPHIQKRYLNLVTFLMIQNQLMYKYSSIWKKEYDSNFDFWKYYEKACFSWRQDYIKECFSKNILVYNDNKGIISLSYFLAKQDKFGMWFYKWSSAFSIFRQIKSISYLFETNKISKVSNALDESNKKPEDVMNKEDLNSLLEQLNLLAGLKNVKSDVLSLINFLKIRKLREERGLKQIPLSLHLVFSGNPGTGKTTVARLLAKIYHKLGILSKGHLIEVDRSGLVAGYVGQTAIKVQEVIQEALGGILFIDEAYSLTVNRSESDFGFEAVDTLLKGMEDHRDDLIVIVAGYPELMNEFLNSNPGLRSRFNKFINFTDYTPQELLDIFKNLCDSSGYTASTKCIECVQEYFEKKYTERHSDFANGRDVRNYFEIAIVNQANRLSSIDNISDEALSKLELEDIQNIRL